MNKENPFKKINYPEKEVPKELKSKVMADVASVKLLMDMASLFTINYSTTIDHLLKSKNKKPKN